MQFGKQLGLIDRRPHLGASRETRDGMAELMAVLGLHSVRTRLITRHYDAVLEIALECASSFVSGNLLHSVESVFIS